VDASTGIISTIAGTNASKGSIGEGDGGLAVDALLRAPGDLAIDSAGNLFLVDEYSVRRIDASSGIIITVAGTGNLVEPYADGVSATSVPVVPAGLTTDAAGNLFIADNYFNVVRRVDAVTGIVTTVVGNTDSSILSGDGGLATMAGIVPRDVAITASGDMLIADSHFITVPANENRVRRVDAATGIITTMAGTGNYENNGLYLGNNGVYTGEPGRPDEMSIDELNSLVIASNDEVYISQNAAVRKILNNDSYDAFPYDPYAGVDSDGDGIPDTLDVFPNDPTAALDSDGDGMPDQFIVGSDTLDTFILVEDLDDDNDGVSDVDEILHGTNPLDSGDFPLAGDITLNGTVNIGDYVVLQQFVLGIRTSPSKTQLLNGDLNANGQLDVGDMVLLQKTLLQ
jgi:hypothetical protein